MIVAENRKQRKARRSIFSVAHCVIFFNGPLFHWVALIKYSVFGKCVLNCISLYIYIYIMNTLHMLHVWEFWTMFCCLVDIVPFNTYIVVYIGTWAASLPLDDVKVAWATLWQIGRIMIAIRKLIIRKQHLHTQSNSRLLSMRLFDDSQWNNNHSKLW